MDIERRENDSRLPLRPTEPEDVSRWMHDELWIVLNKRWYFMAQERMNIGKIKIFLGSIQPFPALRVFTD
jgi:hypothetical protein